MKKILLTLCFVCLCVLSQAQQQKLRVAVLDPTTSGIAMDDGTKLAVQELISSTFVNTGRYIIIERSMIDKIIKEQSFQNSDMADNSQATEIGKLAGANKVVLSAVSLVGGRNMLSIKIIDVTTASIDKQKTKIVGSSDLLDVVEPLTLELLGEEAVYVKQNTVLAQAETPSHKEQPKQSKASSNKKNEPTVETQNPNFNYSKEYQSVCKQIDAAIETAKATPNPKLAKMLAKLKADGPVMLGNNITASISDAGVWTIEGNGEVGPSDEKVFAIQRRFAKVIIVGEGITKISALGGSNVQYVKLPSTLEVIDDECFSGCSELYLVNIPSKMKRIGKEAFKGCKQLSSIALPENIENIGNKAFYECKGLQTITLPNSITAIPEGLFKKCESLREVYFSNKITTIGKDAFSGCKGIQKLYIPNSVVSIGEACFQGMHSLYDIHLSENLTLIPKDAFDDCKALTKITCPASVRSVGESAFEDCENLIQITFLAENMSEFGKECFNDCKNLGNIVLYSLRPPICNKRLFDNDKDDDNEVLARVTLSVQPAALGVYKKANYWEDFNIIIPINQ